MYVYLPFIVNVSFYSNLFVERYTFMDMTVSK
jgi:hypothetical protein